MASYNVHAAAEVLNVSYLWVCAYLIRFMPVLLYHAYLFSMSTPISFMVSFVVSLLLVHTQQHVQTYPSVRNHPFGDLKQGFMDFTSRLSFGYFRLVSAVLYWVHMHPVCIYA